MEECHFTDEMKNEIRNKLKEIGERVEEIVDLIDEKKGCMICEITSIAELTAELDKLVSFYHLQSSLIPSMEGMDNIIRAMAALAAKNHGALVVIERNDVLDSYINACKTTGVFIGATVSDPLLQSIFYPGSPLHDGAVFIRKDKIIAAGCVLPISDRKYTNEGKKIGTRHRAAIGLSERTDALVLVVSEETGEVSYALDGILHPIEIKFCPNAEKAKEIAEPRQILQ